MKKKKAKKKVTKAPVVGKYKVSTNGRRKKKKAATRSSPPETLENVRSLRKEIERVSGVAAAAHREVASVRAELDQHKKRAARTDADLARILNTVHDSIDLVDSRCQKLEAVAGRRALEEVDRKSPAEEAGEFSSELAAASKDAALFEDAPTEVADLPGYDEDPKDTAARIVFGSDVAEEEFGAWTIRKVKKLEEAMKERLSWERDANNVLRGLHRKVRDDVMTPPDGCEVVVRREKR